MTRAALRDAALVAELDELRGEVARLRQQVEAPPAEIPIPGIRRLVVAAAAEFGVTPGAILSARRDAEFVLPRQVVMHLAADRLHRSLPSIGRCLRRDHSTVFHGARRIAARLPTDPDLAARVERVAHAALSPEATENAA